MVYKTAKKVVIFVVGVTVLLLGIALIVLPGPAFLVIPAGLAILATEFLWAKHLLNKFKSAAQSAGRGAKAAAGSMMNGFRSKAAE